MPKVTRLTNRPNARRSFLLHYALFFGRVSVSSILASDRIAAQMRIACGTVLKPHQRNKAYPMEVSCTFQTATFKIRVAVAIPQKPLGHSGCCGVAVQTPGKAWAGVHRVMSSNGTGRRTRVVEEIIERWTLLPQILAASRGTSMAPVTNP